MKKRKSSMLYKLAIGIPILIFVLAFVIAFAEVFLGVDVSGLIFWID